MMMMNLLLISMKSQRMMNQKSSCQTNLMNLMNLKNSFWSPRHKKICPRSWSRMNNLSCFPRFSLKEQSRFPDYCMKNVILLVQMIQMSCFLQNGSARDMKSAPLIQCWSCCYYMMAWWSSADYYSWVYMFC